MLGQVFLIASRSARCAVIFRMLFECEAMSVVEESRTASATGRVGDNLVPISTGTWLMMMVDPRWSRSSATSRGSRPLLDGERSEVPVIKDEQIAPQ